MARRHIEIIPGKNGHKVRHFHAVNEGGTPAYQSDSLVFGNAEDMANHIEGFSRSMGKKTSRRWQRRPKSLKEAARLRRQRRRQDDNSPAGLGGKRGKSLARKVEGHVE
jgi:hypothetical protein